MYVNIVGGLHPEGTSTDLAVAAAIWSDEKGIPIPSDTLIIGEIGLTGDLRPVQGAEKLVSEAARMGFRRVVLPKRSVDRMLKKAENVELTGVKSLAEALRVFA